MSYLRSRRNILKKKNSLKQKHFWLTATVLVCIIIYVLSTAMPKTDPFRISSIPSAIEKPRAEAPLPPLPEKFDPPEGSILIPYWKVASFSEPILPDLVRHKKIRHIIYFGVTPNDDGALDQSEPGYSNIARFSEKAVHLPGTKLLTLRMMNEDTNEAILGNKAHQEDLINETILLAQKYSFNGLFIDLEHSVLPTKDTVDEISQFLERSAALTHAHNLTFTVALYGDTFYRQRPYDVKKIASFSDEIMIMAYDFHKSYGEPGPNFPLFRGKMFPYDFASMLDDFIKAVPQEKMTVLFGLFGYDWSVDDQNRPAKAAKAITLKNIESTLIPLCNSTECKKIRDVSAHEMNITYSDESGQKHSVWFEDSLSLKAKVSYLSTKNVVSIGYWAFGYY